MLVVVEKIMNNKFEYYNSRNGNSVDFSDGVLSVSAYSYYIDSYEEFELSKEDTKKLYEAMKEFYETK